MSHASQAIFTIVAVLAFAIPVSAQQGQFAQVGSEEITTTLSFSQTSIISGPTMAGAAFTGSVPQIAFSQKELSVLPAALRQPTRRNVALMVVGGTGLLVGAVIGGDEGTVIMIAGGGVGLFGLWRYLS